MKIVSRIHRVVSPGSGGLASGQTGVALPVAIMILAVLTLLGSSAIVTSNIEVEIASNEKLYQSAFYASNGAADLAPRVVRDAINAGGYLYYPTEADVQVQYGLIDELLNFETGSNDGATDSTQVNPDIQLGGAWFVSVDSVGVDVDRDPMVRSLPGGGVEFGSGYEGIGGGSASSGLAILYRIESKSRGPRNASSVIQTQYLYVIGVGGSS